MTIYIYIQSINKDTYDRKGQKIYLREAITATTLLGILSISPCITDFNIFPIRLRIDS